MLLCPIQSWRGAPLYIVVTAARLLVLRTFEQPRTRGHSDPSCKAGLELQQSVNSGAYSMSIYCKTMWTSKMWPMFPVGALSA